MHPLGSTDLPFAMHIPVRVFIPPPHGTLHTDHRFLVKTHAGSGATGGTAGTIGDRLLGSVMQNGYFTSFHSPSGSGTLIFGSPPTLITIEPAWPSPFESLIRSSYCPAVLICTSLKVRPFRASGMGSTLPPSFFHMLHEISFRLRRDSTAGRCGSESN